MYVEFHPNITCRMNANLTRCVTFYYELNAARRLSPNCVSNTLSELIDLHNIRSKDDPKEVPELASSLVAFSVF